MIFKKLVFTGLFISISGLLSGCKTDSLIKSNESISIASPRSQEHSARPLSFHSSLLVGLKPYLGRGTTDLRRAKELHLKSLGKPLVLKDANGLTHKSSAIAITWRKVPLLKEQIIERQVAGPFASFESAERLALRLRNKGLPAVVAHPNEWEVWVSKDFVLPKEMGFASWKQTKHSKIVPALKGQSGELLLSGPLKIAAPDGLLLGQGVYFGPFWLKADSYGSWTLVEQVPMERYLLGVVPHEIGFSAPQAALATQAVLARTWALANSHRFAVDGYHLCSDTQCQVYKDPQKANSRIKNAISQTAGKYLSSQRKPIHAVYHASNGGVMAASTEAWSMEPLPYLQARLDGSNKWRKSFNLPLVDNSTLKSFLSKQDGAYGNAHPRFRWTRTLNAEDLKAALPLFQDSNTLPKSVKVLKRGASGRVLSLEIASEDNKLRMVLKLDEIRRMLRMLPSTLFVVNELKEGYWQFIGGGFGHGAGLSQAGAIDLAQRGWQVSEILRHYYPGSTYRTLQDLPKAP